MTQRDEVETEYVRFATECDITEQRAVANIKAARSTPQESKRLQAIYMAHLEIASKEASIAGLKMRLAAENKAGKAASIIMDEFPSGTRVGGARAEEEGFHRRKMANTFQVIRVYGHVRWKDHGSGDATAKLILKRGEFRDKFRTEGKLEWLYLAEYARGSCPNEVTTVVFDFKPDEQNPFWLRGSAGNGMSAIPSGFYCEPDPIL